MPTHFELSVWKEIDKIPYGEIRSYKEIAINGRQHVIDRFNWAKITKQYENIILKTIEKFNDADL